MNCNYIFQVPFWANLNSPILFCLPSQFHKTLITRSVWNRRKTPYIQKVFVEQNERLFFLAANPKNPVRQGRFSMGITTLWALLVSVKCKIIFVNTECNRKTIAAAVTTVAAAAGCMKGRQKHVCFCPYMESFEPIETDSDTQPDWQSNIGDDMQCCM